MSRIRRHLSKVTFSKEPNEITPEGRRRPPREKQLDGDVALVQSFTPLYVRFSQLFNNPS